MRPGADKTAVAISMWLQWERYSRQTYWKLAGFVDGQNTIVGPAQSPRAGC